MAKTLSAEPVSLGSSANLNDNPVQNKILLALPSKEYDAVFSELKFMELQASDLLNEMAAPIEYCYFVNSGLVSIVTVLSDGKSVEVGLTGKEGFVGLPLVVGLTTSPVRAIVQVAGSGFRITASRLASLLVEGPELEKMLNRYSQQLGLQTIQVAACNRLHGVEQRLARWLLMTQDRIGGDMIPLTQEFLSHMLGTRRASVTVAAGVLQKMGSIRYSRGNVTVLDRGKLETITCECYGIITRQALAWQNEAR